MEREAAPRPEHPGEHAGRLNLPSLDMGVYSPPSAAASDYLFHQPGSGGDLACVCDSELSNCQELANHLRQNGVDVGRKTPAEVIGKLIASEGERGFSLMRGAFSCAVWSADRLWLAVDRFGMKRLSYGITAGNIRFSSRIEWLQREFAELSLSAIYQYLNLSFVPSPESICKNVRKLSPGCYLVWDGKQAHISRYWEMSYPEDLQGDTLGLADQLREQLFQAVRRSTENVSRNGAGCFLSGGTDSSTVLGMAARSWESAPPAFSIGFPDDAFNELRYSRIAARHFGAEANEFIVQAEDGWNCLPALVHSFDEPFGNPSAVGGFLCAQMAASHDVQVLLAGDGGDELFGGNERYRKDKIYGWIESLPRFTVQNVLWNLVFAATRNVPAAIRLKNMLFRATLKNPERFYLEDCLTGDLNGSLLNPEFAESASGAKPLEMMQRVYAQAPAHSDLNRLLFLDLKFTIADNDLVKVRQTAAAHGVRIRYPMLEHSLAEFSGRMPADLKVHGLEKRYLFKRALRDFLPRDVLAKTKHGFGVPVSLWLCQDPRFRELLLDVTHDRVLQQRAYFKTTELLRVVDEHLRGIRDWGQLLWAVIMLEVWNREKSHA